MCPQSRNDSIQIVPPTDPPLSAEQRAMQCRLAGTNIHEKTFLATDYLNHFNEVIMLLEMLPDMPEMLDEIALWAPKSYTDHFRESGFKDGALAIEAYECAPTVYRNAFDHHVAALNAVILDTIAALGRDGGTSEAMHRILEPRMAQAHALLEMLSGIIHGSTTTLDQSDVDRTFEAGEEADDGDGRASDQAAIDALFD